MLLVNFCLDLVNLEHLNCDHGLVDQRGHILVDSILAGGGVGSLMKADGDHREIRLGSHVLVVPFRQFL